MQIKNFLEMTLEDLPNCHEGEGILKHIEVFSGEEFDTNIRFFNYTILPPGTSIGNHKHGNDEEIYIVLEGEGIFYMDEKEYPVRAGSIMKNNPYGIHGLRNTGDAELKILVFENAKDEK